MLNRLVLGVVKSQIWIKIYDVNRGSLQLLQYCNSLGVSLLIGKDMMRVQSSHPDNVCCLQ